MNPCTQVVKRRRGAYRPLPLGRRPHHLYARVDGAVHAPASLCGVYVSICWYVMHGSSGDRLRRRGPTLSLSRIVWVDIHVTGTRGFLGLILLRLGSGAEIQLAKKRNKA